MVTNKTNENSISKMAAKMAAENFELIHLGSAVRYNLKSSEVSSKIHNFRGVQFNDVSLNKNL